MKVSDYMLDLNTGDASFTEAYAIEAVGKMKIACEVFNMMNKIYDSADLLDPTVMEAAFDSMAGGILKAKIRSLPEQKKVAIDFGSEAIDQAINATYTYMFKKLIDISDKASYEKLLKFVQSSSMFSKDDITLVRTVIKASVMKDIVKKYYEYIHLIYSISGKEIKRNETENTVRSYLDINTTYNTPTSYRGMRTAIKDATAKLDEINKLINNKRNYVKTYTFDDLGLFSSSLLAIQDINKSITSRNIKDNVTKIKELENSTKKLIAKFEKDNENKENSSDNVNLFINAIESFAKSTYVNENESPLKKLVGDSVATIIESIKK